MGSIERNADGPSRITGVYPYRTSKTALNMITKSLSIDLKPAGILVIAMCPGWVQTDMGGKNARFTPFESISLMINTIKNINDSVIGKLLDNKGDVIPF